MFYKGDRVELVKDATFGWGTLNKGEQGTFIDYQYGITIDNEFLPFDEPSCIIKFDAIKGQCVCEHYEIRKVRE